MMDMYDLFQHLRLFYSMALLVLSIVLIMGMIFTKQTRIAQEVHPALAFFMAVGSITWLTMVEGGQGSLVGLTPVKEELYKVTHPYSYKCTKVTNKGDNLDRYLLGRQFMVVLIVFAVNLAASPVEGATLWGLPQLFNDIFYGTGLVMVLFTCMVGQLNSQVNASLCMLDYINNYFAYVTLWVALAIEFSGLLHASYVIQILVGWSAGKPIESKDKPRTFLQNIFFWFRCIMSVVILVFCFAVTLAALFEGKTTMWEGVPPAVAICIFFVLMSIVGMLEGMQIAFFAVAKLPASERGQSVFALKTSHILYSGEGHNLPGFMIGRQLLVVTCMFFVARVTSVSIPDEEENIFGVGQGLQNLFDTGLLGALALTIIGSIAWQLVASAFPIAFMSSPITYSLLRICLFLEATGICHGAWILAAIHKKIAGFERDELYIGTAEQRAAWEKGDDVEQLQLGVGHLVKLPGFADNAPKSLKQLLIKDENVRDYMESLYAEEDEENANDRNGNDIEEEHQNEEEWENANETEAMMPVTTSDVVQDEEAGKVEKI